MPLLDTKTITIATVLAPAALGVIENIRYWNDITGTYVTTPPTNIPFGGRVGATCTMKNTGTVNQRMHLRFNLRRPDGTTKSVLDLSASPVTLAPGASSSDIGWTDYADMAGTWTMVIELHGEVV